MGQAREAGPGGLGVCKVGFQETSVRLWLGGSCGSDVIRQGLERYDGPQPP